MGKQDFDVPLAEGSYLRAGEGDPLLLIHPFCTDAAIWRSTLPHLTDEFEVLAPTVAGHNRGQRLEGDISMSGLADSVERSMDAAHWETADIAGNSLGGALALELAKRGRAKTVTAIAPAGGWEAGSRDEKLLMAKFLAGFPLIKLLGVMPPQVADLVAAEPHVRKLAMKAVAEHDVPRADAAHLIRAARRCGLFDHILDIKTHRQAETTVTDLATIQNPVLLLTAEKDHVVPINYMARFLDELPNLTHKELKGVGHCPQLEAPALIAQEIKQHAQTNQELAA